MGMTERKSQVARMIEILERDGQISRNQCLSMFPVITRLAGLVSRHKYSQANATKDANHEAQKHNQNSQMQKNSGEVLIRHRPPRASY
jgi:hypothetical protein